MKELVEKSSIQNFKVIFSLRSFYLSKLFWIFAYSFSISGFVLYIYSAYYKLNHNPEIIKSTREVEPEDFPFPAVTFCPNIYAKDNFVEYLFQEADKELLEEECYAITANTHWCDIGGFEFIEKRCEKFNYDEIDIVEFIRETAFDLNISNVLDSTEERKFLTFDFLTDFGVCMSYNLMDLSMIYSDETHEDLTYTSRKHRNNSDPVWTPEEKFKDQKSPQLLTATSNPLRLQLLFENEDQTNFCKGKEFKIFIHKPNEIITRYHQPIGVHYLDTFFAQVTVKSLTTDDALRGFSVDIRKCYFEGERKLKFFKTYTKALCEWGCLTNATLEACECVKFSMPREKETKVCNATKMRTCASSVVKKSCHCYVPCNDVQYTHKTVIVDTLSEAYIEVNIDEFMESIEEIENLLSYKIPNFIADLGGFLGLFLGWSLLSVFESFYFFLIDIWLKYKKRRRTSPEENQGVEDANDRCQPDDKMSAIEKKFEDFYIQYKWEMKNVFESKNDLSQRMSEIEGKLSECMKNFDERMREEKTIRDKKEQRLEDKLNVISFKLDSLIQRENRKDERLINEALRHVGDLY